MTKRRSARGEQVDFDLLRIKEQIAAGPKPVNVQSREEFIDRKVRRRAKKQQITTQNTEVDVSQNLDSVQDPQNELIADSRVVPQTVVEDVQPEQEQSTEDGVRKIKKIR